MNADKNCALFYRRLLRVHRRPKSLSQVPTHRPRRRNSKVKRGRPPGPRMKCGWGCGTRLTASQMRAHFTVCPSRPASDHWCTDEGGTGKQSVDALIEAANAVRLALRRPTYG